MEERVNASVFTFAEHFACSGWWNPSSMVSMHSFVGVLGYISMVLYVKRWQWKTLFEGKGVRERELPVLLAWAPHLPSFPGGGGGWHEVTWHTIMVLTNCLLMCSTFSQFGPFCGGSYQLGEPIADIWNSRSQGIVGEDSDMAGQITVAQLQNESLIFFSLYYTKFIHLV